MPHRLRLTILIMLALVPVLATSVSAQDADADIVEMQETVEAMQTEIASAGYDTIPDARELSQSRFDRMWTAAIEDDPVYGPIKGSLNHSEEFITLEFASGFYTNFALSARFTNPIEDEDESFDFGVEFRISGNYISPARVYLIVTASGNWYAAVGTDREWSSKKEMALGSGGIADFDSSVGGVNELNLIVEGQQAHFAINGTYVASFGLPPEINGALAIGTGFYTGDTVDGRVSRYREFTVWADV